MNNKNDNAHSTEHFMDGEQPSSYTKTFAGDIEEIFGCTGCD